MNVPVVVTLLGAVASSAEPVQVMAPPPPPITADMPGGRGPRNEPPLAMLDIEVKGGAELLWTGSLRIGLGPSEYMENLREAREPCRGGQARDLGADRFITRQLRVFAGRTSYGSPGAADQFVISLNWIRPVPTCEGGGSRTVSFERQVTITPGGVVRVDGDAGVTILLKRRP